MAYLDLSNVVNWICVAVLFCGIVESAGKGAVETQGCKIIRQPFWCHEQKFDEYLECKRGLEVDFKSDVNWQIPSDIPAGTKAIILRNYQFDTLTRKNSSPFKHAQCLIFQDSEINKIEVDAFGDMTELNNLHFQNTRLSDYNQLEFITHQEFRAHIVSASGSTVTGGLYFNGTDNLSRIKQLWLPGNAINYINPSILKKLKNAEILDFSRNQLAELDWESLRNHEKLSNLYIDDNKFQAIPEWVAYRMKEVGLSNNSWHCNCDLKWITEAASFDSIIKPEELECTTPLKKRVVNMSKEEFVCRAPHEPIITWKKHGPKYLVQCTSVADPPPKLALALAPTGVTIANFPATNDISQRNTTSRRIEVLPGNYSCVAENPYGISHTVATIPSKQEQADDSSAGNRLSPKLFIFLIAIITCSHL